MVSNGADGSGSDGFDGSWFDRPARVWLEAHYGFRLPPLRYASSHQQGRRAFPAQVWVAQRSLRQ